MFGSKNDVAVLFMSINGQTELQKLFIYVPQYYRLWASSKSSELWSAMPKYGKIHMTYFTIVIIAVLVNYEFLASYD